MYVLSQRSVYHKLLRGKVHVKGSMHGVAPFLQSNMYVSVCINMEKIDLKKIYSFYPFNFF